MEWPFPIAIVANLVHQADGKSVTDPVSQLFAQLKDNEGVSHGNYTGNRSYSSYRFNLILSYKVVHAIIEVRV